MIKGDEDQANPALARALGQAEAFSEIAEYAQRRAKASQEAADLVRQTERKQAEIPDPLEADLEALAWKQAQSGKCDYVQNVPLGLVQKVRERKGGVRGTLHHFTAHAVDQTLFRYKRGTKP